MCSYSLEWRFIFPAFLCHGRKGNYASLSQCAPQIANLKRSAVCLWYYGNKYMCMCVVTYFIILQGYVTQVHDSGICRSFFSQFVKFNVVVTLKLIHAHIRLFVSCQEKKIEKRGENLNQTQWTVISFN